MHADPATARIGYAINMQDTLPIEFVAESARRLWDQTHGRGFLAWALRGLGAMRPAEVIYIAEYRTGDWDTAHCIGEPQNVWSYSGTRIESIREICALDESSAIASKTPVIRYCLDDKGARMIYNEWHGFRAAGGYLLMLTNQKWVAESAGPNWKS